MTNTLLHTTSSTSGKNPLKVIVAGGGTGGHIFPAIAIANAIKSIAPDTQFLFIGAQGKMEMEKVPQAGYTIEGLDIAGFNRTHLIKNIGLPFKLLKSFLQVRRIFKSFKPDAVIGVGGYASFPVLKFAQTKGIKTFIHESNSFAGKSNQLLGKKATRIYVAIDGMERFFPSNKILVSGNPVRKLISDNPISKDAAVRFFGLNPAKKIILSIGGSLGAKSINEAIDEHLDLFIKNGFQLIWQTGKPFVNQAKLRAEGKPEVWVNDFISQMEYAYAAADVVISRSGAMAVAELCVMKKPVMFVPFPFAAEDHQTVNAARLVEKNAALMMPDANVKKHLVQEVIRLALNDEQQQQLIQQISTLAIINADEIIAKDILAQYSK
jgi:UDP-N-acetylglucosamine--N-acetylmuramyl-(pentapeptide) pyrophosphoryl-undecaprenol N-acetylglucosamine transferase